MGESPKRAKSWVLWVAAFLLTAGTAVYQRMTGPTYPVRGSATVGSAEVPYRLLRSYDGPDDAPIRVTVPDAAVKGRISFRRFPTADPLVDLPMTREGDELVGRLPHQLPAGKVQYQVVLEAAGGAPVPLTADPVVLRFRGAVPLAVLITHVIVMFGAMLYSTRAGLEEVVRGGRTVSLAAWTCWLLLAGGLVLGPVVQKYAFDAYWTGWPFGNDLTDNKTIAAFLIWLAAWWRLRRSPGARGWAVAAAILTLVVFLIPHSVLGSELDYSKAPR